MNPYGITQVDIPGVLGVYESAKSNRLREMQVKRQFEREDRDEERRIKRESLLAKIYQPRGGDPASAAPSGGGFDARMNEEPMSGAPAQLVDPSQLPPRTDGLRINQDALKELYALDPQEAMAIQKSVYDMDASRLKAIRENGEQMQAIAYHLSTLPMEQRAAEVQKSIPMLQQIGMDVSQITQADLTDEGLQRYMRYGRSIKDLFAEDQGKYIPVGFDQELVNTRDPAALAELARRRAGEQGAAPAPPPGFVIDGGPTPSASGGF